MLLSGTCNMPPGIFFKIRSSEVDSNGFWGCYYLHPCVSKIKILGGGGGYPHLCLDDCRVDNYDLSLFPQSN